MCGSDPLPAFPPSKLVGEDIKERPKYGTHSHHAPYAALPQRRVKKGEQSNESERMEGKGSGLPIELSASTDDHVSRSRAFAVFSFPPSL